MAEEAAGAVVSVLAVPEVVASEAALPASLAAAPACVALTPASVALTPEYVAGMSGGFLARFAGTSSSVVAGAVGLAIAVCGTGRVMIGMTGTTTSAL